MDNDISPQGYGSPLANMQPVIPDERKIAAEKERNDTLSQLPLLKAVLKDLDKRINQLNDRKYCRTQRTTKYAELTAEQFDVVADIATDILTSERNHINNRIVRARG